MNPGRNQTLVRVLSLMRLVEGRYNCDLEVLAMRFGVTTRTIRRDLHALAAAGVSVPHRDRDRGTASQGVVIIDERRACPR
jgi:predicted DNA-binding transcriptional regulator YafY